MYNLIMLIAMAGIFTFSSGNASAEPQQLCARDASVCVTGVLAIPETAGPHPAVVVLHGADGWRTDIALLAKVLSDSGFVTLALDYYAGLESTSIWGPDRSRNWPHYQESVRNAVTYLQTLPNVSDRPVGLWGSSLGSFLAVSVAASIPAVEAVVGLSGGGGAEGEPIEKQVKGFPPILILHGDNDKIVPIEKAYELRDAVMKSNGEVELHAYPGMGHAFSGAAGADMVQRTVKFLKAHLDN